MNKIYKVKKNAAGHLVACSEFAKGHTKKAVLGSLLIVGALGMATTASAQQPNNRKNGTHSTISGGSNNTTKGRYSTISGGGYNEATNEYSTIGGGGYNKAKGRYSTIGGGLFNEATNEYSTISGGGYNEATNEYSTIGGGGYNKAKGRYSTIGGGDNNIATGKYSTIAGGRNNQAKGIDSTIAGGRNNQATKENSTVGGGGLNQATGHNSTVAGGYNNRATGIDSTIAGGRNNQAKGTGSFAAGVDNQANADNTVALGKKNIIQGKDSVAIGSNNTVKQNQTNVFILGSNTDTKDAQSGSVLLGDKTTGKTATAVNDATVNGLTLKNFAGTSATNGVVSVGRAGGERQIVNVGAGRISKDSTDAVNGSQLHALATVVAQNKADIKDLDDEVGLLGEEINSLEGEIFNNQDAIAKNQADIKTLKNNVEEGLLDLSGRLIDQKADLTKDIKTLKNNVEEGLLDLSGRLIDQKADIAKNQADIAQNQTDIQDLAAYNELQDQYAQKQTEAIDALNKASSANTDRIATAELGIAENKKDAQIAKAQANENKDGIAKNQADIQLHDKKITNLGILHSMVARAVGNNTQGVATNKADIAKNQADIANNIKNIYELAQQQDQHSSDIKTLAKVSAANTDRIAKNKAEADASFETLTKNQNTLIEQGEALVEQNKAINQELEGFAAHADVQDKQILQNQADITANKTAIEQNINRTVANGFEIEKNKAGIATNKQELILQNDRLNRINETNNHQDQKIDQLGYALKEQGQHFNNRISAVERQTAGGIANAIAIATLPSPSRAGEHHVLFGSGYHNGQAAVSLGAAGLSDTGKSTYKIGLSWSDAGGLSGGVGGSYRWK
ncbi:YadA-like family protein [Moraxella catarrhalis]|uniref:YadA-like family protein n=1 Tax=Moraxella catarrhalis TaxID=480 RepID=UPI000EA9D900|nr:YadA-like family protein [Moraxella catarrhalis]MCG6835513.1 YadA-like family protein [Moraxella catarrhalis]RKL70982.1 cell surface protein [Moraxella catarrhalis]